MAPGHYIYFFCVITFYSTNLPSMIFFEFLASKFLNCDIIIIILCITKINFLEVGPSYGRRMMKGYLTSQGISIGEKRIAASLQRVDPLRHQHCQNQTHRNTNPVHYKADYFGEKIHIHQNEKIAMYGVIILNC